MTTPQNDQETTGAAARAGMPDDFDDVVRFDQRDEKTALVIDLDGFEGPLDLLLNLARSQKVDLTKISILALAEQYLTFINNARKLRLELAADYLVMAAWLAYLKSKLLLPEPEEAAGASGEELAAMLAFRLKRLEAMREAAANLMARNCLGRDVFARGQPEGIRVITTREYSDNLYDLLAAYATRVQRSAVTEIKFKRLPVWSIKQARQCLESLLGEMDDWGTIDTFLVEYLTTEETRSSVMASSFSATLELVREGALELKQTRPFAPLYMRKRKVA